MQCKNLMVMIVLMEILVFNVKNIGADTVAQVYNLTAPKLESRKIGVTTYEYEVSYYSPPVDIQFTATRSDARYDTPEAAVTSFYSSILANDFEWWFSSFDQNRQKELLEQRKSEYDEIKDKSLKEWSDSFKGKTLKFNAHIRYKEYILIDSIVYNPDGIKTGRKLACVKYENNAWKVTLDKGPAAFFMFKWD